jgi:hypothetical protein
MFDRIMATVLGLGLCVAAVFLLLNRYTAPGCGAEVTTTKLVPQLMAETGLSGLYLLDTQSIGGGLLAGSRQCVVDVAQIQALQPLGRAHWLKVIYSTRIDRPTGVVTVQSHLAGPVTPVFNANPNT